ncbi:hypothetical protein D3C81_2234700 [compost metagenome]
MNLNAVNKELLLRGVLVPGNDGKAAQSLRLPGMPRARTYVVSASALMADDNGQSVEAA